jgi:hypothetical protein
MSKECRNRSPCGKKGIFSFDFIISISYNITPKQTIPDLQIHRGDKS